MNLNELRDIIESGYTIRFEPGIYEVNRIVNQRVTDGGLTVTTVESLCRHNPDDEEVPFDNMTEAVVALYKDYLKRSGDSDPRGTDDSRIAEIARLSHRILELEEIILDEHASHNDPNDDDAARCACGLCTMAQRIMEGNPQATDGEGE
jgi:hypothetical protein